MEPKAVRSSRLCEALAATINFSRGGDTDDAWRSGGSAALFDATRYVTITFIDESVISRTSMFFN
jgi:hypothetical protein